jgi:hypothetical protein
MTAPFTDWIMALGAAVFLLVASGLVFAWYGPRAPRAGDDV